jgi:hypothetical protein
MDAEQIQIEINTYKQLLTQTDYKSLKHADGALTDEEYQPTKEQRASWRARINELEQQLEEGE